jgi:hypothetical protein
VDGIIQPDLPVAIHIADKITRSSRGCEQQESSQNNSKPVNTQSRSQVHFSIPPILSRILGKTTPTVILEIGAVRHLPG